MKTIHEKEMNDLIIEEPTEAPNLERAWWLEVYAPFIAEKLECAKYLEVYSPFTAPNLKCAKYLDVYAPFNAPNLKEVRDWLRMDTQFYLIP